MIQTCWMKMVPIHETSLKLKIRYDQAFRVIPRNDGQGFGTDNDMVEEPSKNDLVFSEASPNFCIFNPKIGVFGTRGRRCDNTMDGCQILCCDRGFKENLIEMKNNCKCKFKWLQNSAHVACEFCIEKKSVQTCK